MMFYVKFYQWLISERLKSTARVHFDAALPIYHHEKCYIIFKYQLTIYKKQTNYVKCRNHVLLTRKTTLLIFKKEHTSFTFCVF